MDWCPTLKEQSGPVYQRIVKALAEDIAQGRLYRGQQLPTHRALASALGIDLTTVSHAYAEARRRGLVQARVGQGTFVAESIAAPVRADEPGLAYDLSMNLPPQPLAAGLEGRITRGIAAIEREVGFGAHLTYRAPGGSPSERAAAAAWLLPRLPQADPDRLVICPGTQTALFTLLSSLAGPGDVLLTDPLTYPGVKAAAAQLRMTLVGVAGDNQGMSPAALDAACRRHRPKALYLVPTIHNPTTVTMPPSRRAEIAAVIRARKLLLIEDDAYGALAPDCVPLAALVPEHSYYVASLSKCIAPGLRVSFLLAPDSAAAAGFAAGLRAVVQMPVSLTVALAARWIEEGSADVIVAAIREEAAARQSLAAAALAGQHYAAHPSGHHVWLSLPRRWGRAEFAAHVQRQGLAVVTSDSFSVTEQAPHAIRIALGAARSRFELGRALELLVAALQGAPAVV